MEPKMHPTPCSPAPQPAPADHVTADNMQLLVDGQMVDWAEFWALWAMMDERNRRNQQQAAQDNDNNPTTATSTTGGRL